MINLGDDVIFEIYERFGYAQRQRENRPASLRELEAKRESVLASLYNLLDGPGRKKLSELEACRLNIEAARAALDFREGYRFTLRFLLEGLNPVGAGTLAPERSCL